MSKKPRSFLKVAGMSAIGWFIGSLFGIFLSPIPWNAYMALSFSWFLGMAFGYIAWYPPDAYEEIDKLSAELRAWQKKHPKKPGIYIEGYPMKITDISSKRD